MMAGMTRFSAGLLFLSATLFSQAQTSLQRNGQTIVVEPYAPNVVRVTLSMIAREAGAAPGYGFVAKPAGAGWNHSVAANGADVYVSSRMTVTVAPERRRDPNAKLPDTAKFFSGSVPGASIRFTLPDGSPLAEMDG